MRETHPRPTSFEQTYEKLYAMATTATDDRTRFALRGNDYNAELYRYTHTTPAAYGEQADQTNTHHYEYWRLNKPQVVHVVSRQGSVGNRVDAAYPAYSQSHSKLGVTQLSSAFIDRAAHIDQLQHVSSRSLTWLAEQTPVRGDEIHALIARILLKGVALQAFDEPGAMQDITGLSPNHSHYRQILHALGTTFGRVLGWDPASGTHLAGLPDYAERVPKADVTRALTLLSSKGLVGEVFWERYAPRVAISSSETHSFLRKQLYGADGANLRKADSRNGPTVSEYVTNLFAKLATDPCRYEAHVRGLQRRIADCKTNGILQTTAFIDLSNRFAYQLRGSQAEQLANHLPANTSSALIPCLFLTRRMNAPPEIKIAQLEQDILYSEMIAVTGPQYTRQRHARTLAAVALQHPGATGEQLQKAERLIRYNKSIREVIKIFS